MLEPDDEVVGVAHEDHVARDLTPSPAQGPEIECVVQIDVGEQRRDYRALPRPSVTDRHHPVFHDARLQPFLDQADDAPVADPMLQEADQPFLVDLIEERSDVGVQYEAHLLAVDPDTESIQRVMRAAPRPESVRHSEEIFLVDRVQQRDHRPLDDLVLQRGYRERALPAIWPGYVDPPAWPRPIRSASDPVVQIFEIALKVCLVVLPRQSVHSRCRVHLEFVEHVLEKIDADVVGERDELLLLPFPCDFPYALQRMWHAGLALCPGHGLLARISLGPYPWLHWLRCSWLRRRLLRSKLFHFVRRLHCCWVGGGALDCSRADLRPPHKLDVQFSRIQLSRRRSPLSGDGRDQRDKIDKPELAVELAAWQRCPAAAAPFELTSTPNEGATPWIAPNCPPPPTAVGSRMTAARVTRGAISLSSSNHFVLTPYSNPANPVALP